MADYRIAKKALVASLEHTHRMPTTARTKLETRLMVLARTAFPEGVRAGRGFRGGYSVDQFWQIILAFQMIEIGVPVHRIAQMVNESWDIAYLAIAKSLPDHTIEGMRFWWMIEPAGLSDFDLQTERRTKSELVGSVRPIETIGTAAGETLEIGANNRGLRVFSVVDATAVVRDVLEALGDPALEIDQDGLKAALNEWASAPFNRLLALSERGS